jgi:hypothetical protein
LTLGFSWWKDAAVDSPVLSAGNIIHPFGCREAGVKPARPRHCKRRRLPQEATERFRKARKPDDPRARRPARTSR